MKLILCQLYKYTLRAAKMKVLRVVGSLHFAVVVKLVVVAEGYLHIEQTWPGMCL